VTLIEFHYSAVLTSAPNISFTAFAERVRNDFEMTVFYNEQPFE